MTARSLLGVALVFVSLAGCGGSTGSSPDHPGAVGAGGSSAIAGGLPVGGHAGASAFGTAGASSTAGGTGGTSGGSGGRNAGSAGAVTGGSANGGSTGNPNGGNASAGAAGGGVALLTPTINAFCQAAQSCCAKQPNITPMLTDCASGFPTRNKVLASIDTGGVTVNAAALARCLAAYQQAATECDENTVLAACQGVFTGTKAEGEPCANGTECNTAQGPTTCLFTNGDASPGVCKRTTHGKAGDACVSTCRTTGDCSYETYGPADTLLTWCFEADGLSCDLQTATCQPLVALGQSCSSSDACGTGNICDSVCKKGATIGQSCATTQCIPELECSLDGVCVDPPFGSEIVCAGYSLGPY